MMLAIAAAGGVVCGICAGSVFWKRLKHRRATAVRLVTSNALLDWLNNSQHEFAIRLRNEYGALLGEDFTFADFDAIVPEQQSQQLIGTCFLEELRYMHNILHPTHPSAE